MTSTIDITKTDDVAEDCVCEGTALNPWGYEGDPCADCHGKGYRNVEDVKLVEAGWVG